jgi:hypothetical protein
MLAGVKARVVSLPEPSTSDADVTMGTRRGLISISVLLLLSISATPFVAARSHASSPARSEVEACTLLSNADASKALEVSSVTGHRLVASSPTGCVWSNDPAASDSSRRVVLVTHSPNAFQIAKHSAITTIKIEPVAGIGEDAFYQIYPGDSPPFIWVRKGNTAISIRILIGTKPRPFTLEQERSKVATLAKAAVAKL